MRIRVGLLAFAAALLAGPRPAAAQDAGEFAGAEGGSAEPSDSDGAPDAGLESVGDSGESDGPALVIACDGALCDTTQGRPSCSAAAPAVGFAGSGFGAAGCAAIAMAFGLVRRGARGA